MARASVIVQFFSKSLNVVAKFIIGISLARYLGPSEFGILAFSLALVGLISPFVKFGIRENVAILLPNEANTLNLLTTALTMNAVNASLVIVIILMLYPLFENNVVLTLALFGTLNLLIKSSDILESELQQDRKGVEIGKIQIFQSLVEIFVFLLAIQCHANLLFFGFMPLTGGAIRFLLLLRISSFRLQYSYVKFFDLAIAKKLLQRGLPLAISSMSIIIFMKSDQIMLNWLMNSETVGQYSVAVSVAESLYFIPIVLSQTLIPRIGRSEKSEEDRTFRGEKSLRDLYRSCWISGVLMSLCTLFVYPWVLRLAYGYQYINASYVLYFLAPASFFVATGCASSAWLNANGYQKLIAARSLVGACLNVFLNLLLIPEYGMIGAAISTSISYGISVYGLCLLNSKTRSNFIHLLAPL